MYSTERELSLAYYLVAAYKLHSLWDLGSMGKSTSWKRYVRIRKRIAHFTSEDHGAPANNAFPMTVDWSQPHNFGVELQPTFIRFWFDSEVVDGNIVGEPFNEVTSDQWYSMNAQGVHYPGNAPFNSPFNIVLNVAVGGG